MMIAINEQVGWLKGHIPVYGATVSPTPARYEERSKMKVGEAHERYEVCHFPAGGGGLGFRGYMYSKEEAIKRMNNLAEISGKPLNEFQILKVTTERIR